MFINSIQSIENLECIKCSLLSVTGKKIYCSIVMAFYLLNQELNPETTLAKPSCMVGHLACSQGRRIAWDKQVAASRSFLTIAEVFVANTIARNKLQLIR